ncbi:MAG: ATP-binding cassette domain-containing protein [Microscillaceae bacterium]|jgi:ABC-type multidrug transport system ATPase subunit/uncharacterized tellurite resistance protein B-like protein|nr:ATP-binding cassette domain-containing protein [Microscillaceae bacterium]
MNEAVLKSIIQLLAISATIDGDLSESERQVIHEFIYEHINDEQAGNFISLFNDYIEIAVAGNVEAVNICNRINYELNQKQKVIVLSHLLELATADGKIQTEAGKFADQVASAFNIDPDEYELIKVFVTNEAILTEGLPNLLIITGKKLDDEIRHIYRKGFSATIGILRIPSLEMYLLKYIEGNNPTYLNGIFLKDRHLYVFSNGSVLRNDEINSVYYSDVVSRFLQENSETRIVFDARHVYFTFPGGKIGLRDINILEESGRLVGIMGASGSGKSTLLNLLNGNEIPIGGKVAINGIDVHDEEEKEKIKGVVGYVPQDDLLIEELTVFQNMYYAAKLCFNNYSESEIRALVNKTLQSLGLLEIANMKVGNPLQKTISGGQRKRVNIGLELLREPSVLFCDEPTSGLSSNDSENILDLLKELTLKGKLVFVVIHQPSSDIFKMFDKLIILDVGGYQIYYGNPIEGVTYFKQLANLVNSHEGVCDHCGNVNPEQIFNIIETKLVDEYGRYTNNRKVSPVQWRKQFEEVMPPIKVEPSQDTPPSTLKVPSRLRQWLIFTERDLLSKLSDTQYMIVSLLEAPLLALILSYIVKYSQYDYTSSTSKYVFSENMNIPAYIFMSIIVCLFIGLTVSAEEIFKDAKIRKRETFLHLSRNSYLFSKIAILFGFSAVQTLSFVLIGNYILGIEGMHFTYWAVLFSTACFANMLGLNISDTFNSIITIYILIPILLIPQLILGGIVVKFDNINPSLASSNKVPIVSEIMASRWAFEAIMVSQYKDNPYKGEFYEVDKAMATAEYKKVYWIPKLESCLSFVLANYQNPDRPVRVVVERNIKILHNEISKEMPKTPAIQLVEIAQLTPNDFSEDVLEKTKLYIQKIKKYYIKQYNRLSDQKDRAIAKLTRTPALRDAFIAQAQKYHNKTVEELVRNSEEINRVVEINDHLVQKIYPIYLDPPATAWWDFRAHFYAPQKHIFGYYFDTVRFNIGFIWFMSIILYGTLFFRVFHETIKTFTTLLAPKRKRNK